MSSALVTGMEAFSRGWSADEVRNIAWCRALKGTGYQNIAKHNVRFDNCLNQDALRCTVSIDSSTWTGRNG